jgi:hypothetical protein
MHSNEEVLLPTRDFLRQLIGQSKVKTKELTEVLRARGVFTGSDQKEVTGPILIKTGLSPFEYTELRESYKTKEESPKSITRTINWNSDTHLLDAIPDVVDYEALLNDQFGVFSVSSMSGFTALDDNPDHIYMDFKIERKDAVKNWGENVVVHEGRVEIRKEDGGKLLNISLTHTAPETREFGNKVAAKFIRHFKDEGHINQNEQVKVIRFFDFTNEGRVKFLNELTQKALYSMLSFVDTKDIHFSPDHDIANPPHDIAWMKDKIEDMKMKGKGLHSTFFVSDASFHPYIQLFGVHCDYTFEGSNCSGTCRILFEFSDKEESAGSELTLNLSMLKLEANDNGASRSALKKQIIESLEKFKMEAYDLHRSKKP